MRKLATVGVVIGSVALGGALAGCSGVNDGGEEPQGNVTRTDADETAIRGLRGGKCVGYQVKVIDPVRVSHDPMAINNRGQIASSAINDEDVRQAWFWDGVEGHFLVGDRPDGAGFATDVSATGHVVGSTLFLRDYSEMPGSFQFRTRAFRYDGTAVTELGVVIGNSMSRAQGINQHGDVVGSSFGGATDEHAVLFQGGNVIDLGFGRAMAINKSGQVVGGTAVVDVVQAFLYTDGELEVLGTLGGEFSMAIDVNDDGVVVGNSDTASGPSRAFMYSGGAMSELPVPGEISSAAAINRRGQVVGVTSSVATPTVVDGYLFYGDKVTMLRDLLCQPECWDRIDARDINDHGDIVGIGTRTSTSACGEVGRYLIVMTRRAKLLR